MNVLTSHPEEKERYCAALDLSDFTQDKVVSCLVERLKEEKSRLVCEAIASSLIRIGTEAVVEHCAELLRSDDPYVRNLALEILQVLDQRSLAVGRRLLDDPDPEIRIFAVNVLGELRAREAGELLRRVVAEDEDINVVAAAVEYLGELGVGHEDREAVRRAAERFPDPFLTYAVETALKKMGE